MGSVCRELDERLYIIGVGLIDKWNSYSILLLEEEAYALRLISDNRK